jgi:hypothetical protein
MFSLFVCLCTYRFNNSQCLHFNPKEQAEDSNDASSLRTAPPKSLPTKVNPKYAPDPEHDRMTDQPCTYATSDNGCLNGVRYNWQTQYPCFDNVAYYSSQGCCNGEIYLYVAQSCCFNYGKIEERKRERERGREHQ